MAITAEQRRTVFERAGQCCEYCRITRSNAISPFHIDHIVPLKHRGTDDLDNLCLSCYQCNIYKGSNMAADPRTGQPVFLFNPRRQSWNDHFRFHSDGRLVGLTPEGRTTIDVMWMNDESRVQYRQIAIKAGENPC